MIRLNRQTGTGHHARRVVIAIMIGLCLLGGVRIIQGLWIPTKAVVAQVLLEHAFDRSLADQQAHQPWPWADMAPLARLGVPRLGIKRIVLDSGSGQAMAFGPTHLPASAALNTPGTAVLAAHRDTHFRFLQQLHKGDVMIVTTMAGNPQRYRVNDTRIVRWDAFAIPRGQARQRLALATCYPFNATHHGPLRYVVYASLIESRQTAQQHQPGPAPAAAHT